MKAKSIFLDRDGTIIEDSGYVGDPDLVRLIPGAAEAVRRLSNAGYLIVVVSNQSGVARGLFDETALSRVHKRMAELLRAQGAQLHGAYYCPYLDGPEAKVEAYRRASELRKPRPGMILQAAQKHNVDLSRSWMIGDSLTDVEAGRSAGCRTILLSPNGVDIAAGKPTPTRVAGSLLEACEVLVRESTAEENQAGSLDAPRRHDEVVELLDKIHSQLDRSNRRERQHDFSMLRLFGSLIQMFAIVSALWGFIALLDEESAVATAWFAMAGFLQLGSISAFAIDRFR